VPRDLYEDVKQERDDALKLAETRAETIVRLEIELAKLREERAALVKERNQLSKKLESVLSEVEALSVRVKALEDALAKLLAEIVEKDAEIEELRNRLEQLEKVDPLEAYLARVAQVRRDVLRQLRDAIRLDFPDLQVELSEESDALRFQGEGLFASGSSNLRSQKSAIIARLSQRLDEVLPCFTIGPASVFSEVCNPGFIMIEAVQIEGHTDNVGTDVVNRTLSASRANNTFFAMTRAATRIIEHRNLKSQPVLSVAAYGPDRPVTSNYSSAGRATNRRIDLRFIMITPQDTDGIATIRDALSSISEIQQ
jgi:outer membrane protein OmpA-like peptidoglycan-associated protein